MEFGQPYVEASIKVAKIKITRGRYPKASLSNILLINYVLDVDAPKRLKRKDRQIRTSITEETIIRVAELELHDDDR